MSLAPYIVTVITKEDSPYNVVPNAPIEIRARLANGSSGGLSLIYEDQGGITPITQTGATADTNGQFVFYAASAEYNAVYQSQTVPVDMGVTNITLASSLVNVLSEPHIFNTVQEFKDFPSEFPDGKTIHLNDRDADFIKITGILTANNKNIIASSLIDQSIDFIFASKNGDIPVRSLGAVAGADVSDICATILEAGFNPKFTGPFVTYLFDSTVVTKNKVGLVVKGKANLQATALLYPNTAQKYYFFRFIDTIDCLVDGPTFTCIDGVNFSGSKRAINFGSVSRSNNNVVKNCRFVNFQSQPIVAESVDETISEDQPANITNEFLSVYRNYFDNSTGGVITLNGGVKYLRIYKNTFDKPQLGIVKIDGENPPLNGEKCRDVIIKDNIIVGIGSRAGFVAAELFGCEENVKNIVYENNKFYGVTANEAFIIRDGQIPGTNKTIIIENNKFFDCSFIDLVRLDSDTIKVESLYVEANKMYTSTISGTFANLGAALNIDDAIVIKNKIYGTVPNFVISAAESLRFEDNYADSVTNRHILAVTGSVDLFIKRNSTKNSAVTIFDDLTYSGKLEYTGNEHELSSAQKFLDIENTGSTTSKILSNTFPSGVGKQLEHSGATAETFIANNNFGTCTGDAVSVISSSGSLVTNNGYEEILATFRAVNAEVAGNCSGLNNIVAKGVPNVRNYTPLAAGNEF
jgi:hypothetical protein